MKKMPVISGMCILLSVLICGACASQPGGKTIEVIRRGAGTKIGAVFASAAVTENRKNGKVAGDTKKYGFVEGIPVSRATAGKNNGKQQSYTVPKKASEIAYTNAVYEIIQQAKQMGANGLTNVISNVERNYDPVTQMETVKVNVSADAVRLPEPPPAK